MSTNSKTKEALLDQAEAIDRSLAVANAICDVVGVVASDELQRHTLSELMGHASELIADARIRAQQMQLNQNRR